MRLLLATAAVLGAVLAAPAAAGPVDPIVGSWSFDGGIVRIVVQDGGLVGTVVRRTTFAVCPHNVGERIWKLAPRSAGYYRGTHLSFDDGRPGCGNRVSLAASWSLAGEQLVLRVAGLTGHAPGPCGSFQTLCFTLRRVASPPPVIVRYTWSEHIAGRPLGTHSLGSGYLGSVIEGAGGFTARGTETLSSSGIITVTHDYGAADDVKLRLLVSGRGMYAGEATTLRFTTRSSSSPFCFVGEEGQVVVARGRVTVSVCGETLAFVDGRPQGTVVTTAIRRR